MKKKGIRMFTGLMAVSLLFLMTSSCQKEYKVSDLLGTWAYQDNTQYTITFREDGTMGYTAPVSACLLYPSPSPRES